MKPYGNRGHKFYEITNHLGNVLAVISDKKLAHTTNGTTMDYYNPDVVTISDYYPFGMVSRTAYTGFQATDYRYGFNGKENDKDVKGDGDQIDYGNRIYDPRLGRFLSVDRISYSYPQLTPYQFASNRPIDGSDLDGNEWAIETTTTNAGTPQQTITNAMYVRVKVENHSKIVTDPATIKAKAEVYKKAIENNFKTETTELIAEISTKVIYKTEVILDYSPPSVDDPGQIGHLVFDDRTSVKTVTTEGDLPIDTRGSTGSSTTLSNSSYSQSTVTASTPGDTRGIINNFITSIGITMDGKLVKDEDVENTSTHEGGHSAGLNHPWVLNSVEVNSMPGLNQLNSTSRDKKSIRLNFMNSAENPSSEFLPKKNPSQILPQQIKTMAEFIKSKQIWTPKEVKEGPKN